MTWSSISLSSEKPKPGEYTLELAPAGPVDDECGFGLDRALRIPESGTQAAWADALERGVDGAGACGEGSGRVRSLFVVREAGEYLFAIAERVDFERYAPDATRGLCDEYEITILPGHRWCNFDGASPGP